MRIQIKPRNCIRIAEELRQRERLLQGLYGRMDSICVWLRTQSSEADAILYRKLTAQRDHLEEIIRRMAAMRRTLEKVTDLYMRTEDRLADRFEETPRVSASSARTGIKAASFSKKGIHDYFWSIS